MKGDGDLETPATRDARVSCRLLDRERRKGSVAGRVVHRLEAEDCDDARGAGFLKAPAKTADLLADHFQCASNVRCRRP